MKLLHKDIMIAAWLFLACLAVACKKNFLEKQPQDALSIPTFFNTSEDLRVYANGLYNSAMVWYDFQNNADNGGLDLGSDFMIAGTPTTSLYERSSSGIAPAANTSWNDTYDKIRAVNTLLVNYEKVSPRNDAVNQYIGEGYFFRAWHYFGLLVNFGGVPFIDRPLNTTDEDLYRPRESRNSLAMRIIKDLDSAIANLSLKGKGAAGTGRINKEAALTMKARVALYEGSWEYYHNRYNTGFAEAGKDGKAFLEMVEPAVQQVISVQGNTIYREGGVFNEPYNQLFTITNGESTPGVYWYRVYDTRLLTGNSHNFYGKILAGPYFTDKMVNMYLDADGYPQQISARPMKTLDEKGQNLEPRFRQTVWTPDRGAENKLPGRNQQTDVPLRYPVIKGGGTGYRQWKGAVLNRPADFRAGNTDDIFIRYEEALLSLAEAKAILGTLTQADVDKTVNLVRSRVNAVPMTLTTINGWTGIYTKAMGFDPGEPNAVNEIRRERSVEFANEGFRINDLKRWAVFEEAINGYKPKGAWLQEFVDYFNTPARLTADGCNNCLANPKLTPGTDVAADVNGWINPFFNNADFTSSGQGLFVNRRSYLQAIPTGQIDLYKRSGVTLTQNPGWN